MGIQDIVRFSRKELGNDSTGHDFFHAERVANLAVFLYKKDNIYTQQDIKLLLIMGYLHDVIDEKITNNVQQKINQIKSLPSIQILNLSEQNEIFNTIQNMSYSKNIQKKHELSKRGKYIQDADRIDALGAIGIARAFAYGGKKGNLIYNPTLKPTINTSKEIYRNKQTTTINHFYEKLLNLVECMNTVSGRKIAKERTKYMQDFLSEFFKEWNVTK